MRWDGPMWELEYLRWGAVRSDLASLRPAGIAPRLIDGPLPPSCPERPHVRLTDAEARWLKACGVAWEREPELQLALGL